MSATHNTGVDGRRPDEDALLRLRELTVSLPTASGEIRAVDRVSLDVLHGSAVGIVGESGSGKSLLLRAVLGLLPAGARVDGAVRFDGRDLSGLRPRQRAEILGRHIAVIPQDPMTALNPVRRVGAQISEGPRVHHGLTRSAARARATELLSEVGIADAPDVWRRYPHELSGGMRQRALIAMALACEPQLILCDEPTTALDVTVQKKIIELLQAVCADRGVALIFVSHDLAVVSELCDYIGVMYAGQLVETGPVAEVIGDPRHAYTRALLRSLPPVDGPRTRPVSIGGSPPNRLDLPGGCRFHPRCPVAESRCATLPLELRQVGDGRRSACIHGEAGIPGAEHAAAARRSGTAL
jgi:oligopeptide/dipeptide ABC transporter ATP-binding protein